MNLTVLTFAASAPEWVSAIAAAIAALGVIGAGARWAARKVKELCDPGEAPGGNRGELGEIIEDVLRDQVGTRSDRRQFRKEMRDEQRGQPRRVRWQRYLRRRKRRREARKRGALKRRKPVRRAQVQVVPSTPLTEDESSTPGDQAVDARASAPQRFGGGLFGEGKPWWPWAVRWRLGQS